MGYKETKRHSREATSNFDSLGSDSREIIELQRELMEKTNKIEELSEDLKKLLNLLKDDISTPQVNSIYNLEMVLGGIILISAIISYKVLGLIAVPLIIFGLGIFVTSFISKNKVNTLRKGYGI